MPSNYEEYGVLDAKIKDLTNQKDALKVKILEDMTESGEESVSTTVGKFTITKLKTWVYSYKVTEIKEELDAQKAKEESNGEAEFEEKPSLRFTGIKI